MKDTDDELKKLEAVLAGMVQSMDAAGRSVLTRKMAHALRDSQARRIRAQNDPEGQAWTPRKQRPRDRRANRPIRFLYRKPGASEPRIADLRSWRKEGPYIIGFDREADNIRTFLRGRIIRHLPPIGAADPGQMESALRGKKGHIRTKSAAMFVKMRTSRHLKQGSSPTSAWVEFADRAARIARVSQFGLKDKVAPMGPEVRYPQRTLLGYSIEDREALISIALDHLNP